MKLSHSRVLLSPSCLKTEEGWREQQNHREEEVSKSTRRIKPGKKWRRWGIREEAVIEVDMWHRARLAKIILQLFHDIQRFPFILVNNANECNTKQIHLCKNTAKGTILALILKYFSHSFGKCAQKCHHIISSAGDFLLAHCAFCSQQWHKDMQKVKLDMCCWNWHFPLILGTVNTWKIQCEGISPSHSRHCYCYNRLRPPVK